jgi:hypothetical protein
MHVKTKWLMLGLAVSAAVVASVVAELPARKKTVMHGPCSGK